MGADIIPSGDKRTLLRDLKIDREVVAAPAPGRPRWIVGGVIATIVIVAVLFARGSPPLPC